MVMAMNLAGQVSNADDLRVMAEEQNWPSGTDD
jgi:hypothetical protein